MSGDGTMEDTMNVYRALGRIEGAQTQILDNIAVMVDSLGAHTRADDLHFSELRDAVIAKNKLQDDRIEQLEKDANKAKGAGVVILAVLGSIATFIGGAVLAVFSGFVEIKFS